GVGGCGSSLNKARGLPGRSFVAERPAVRTAADGIYPTLPGERPIAAVERDLAHAIDGQALRIINGDAAATTRPCLGAGGPAGTRVDVPLDQHRPVEAVLPAPDDLRVVAAAIGRGGAPVAPHGNEAALRHAPFAEELVEQQVLQSDAHNEELEQVVVGGLKLPVRPVNRV